MPAELVDDEPIDEEPICDEPIEPDEPICDEPIVERLDWAVVERSLPVSRLVMLFQVEQAVIVERAAIEAARLSRRMEVFMEASP